MLPTAHTLSGAIASILLMSALASPVDTTVQEAPFQCNMSDPPADQTSLGAEPLTAFNLLLNISGPGLVIRVQDTPSQCNVSVPYDTAGDVFSCFSAVFAPGMDRCSCSLLEPL